MSERARTDCTYLLYHTYLRFVLHLLTAEHLPLPPSALSSSFLSVARSIKSGSSPRRFLSRLSKELAFFDHCRSRGIDSARYLPTSSCLPRLGLGLATLRQRLLLHVWTCCFRRLALYPHCTQQTSPTALVCFFPVSSRFSVSFQCSVFFVKSFLTYLPRSICLEDLVVGHLRI